MLKIRITTATGSHFEIPCTVGMKIEFVDKDGDEIRIGPVEQPTFDADGPVVFGSHPDEFEFNFYADHMKQFPSSPSLTLEDFSRNIPANDAMVKWLWHIMKKRGVMRSVVNDWCKQLGMHRINEELTARSYVTLLFNAMKYQRGG